MICIKGLPASALCFSQIQFLAANSSACAFPGSPSLGVGNDSGKTEDWMAREGEDTSDRAVGGLCPGVSVWGAQAAVKPAGFPSQSVCPSSPAQALLDGAARLEEEATPVSPQFSWFPNPGLEVCP